MSLKTLLTTMSIKVKIIIACAVVAAAGGIISVVLMTASKADTYRVLKVFELTGSAVVTRQGTGDIDAYVGMNLESGDVLTVCDGSNMRISMDGDKYVLLDGGTVLELIAEGNPADSRTSIKLMEGTILNELTTSLSANSSYEVATPKATMAVRGTSFMVSVEQNEDGSYIIKTNTFHGKVEVMLLDSEGNPTGESAMVTEDNGIIIRTVPDPQTGNPAEVDGTSFFVYEIESGVFVEVPEGGDPVGNIIYEYISKVIKEYALRSNDDGTMPLNEYIIAKLRGELGGAAISVTTSAITAAEVTDNDTVTTTTVTEDSETVTTTVTSAEDRESVTTTVIPTEGRENVTTTAPATTYTESVTTTAPMTTDKETVTTTVPTTKDSEEVTTSTVPTTKENDETSETTVRTGKKKSETTKFVPNPVSIPWTVTTTVPTTVPTTETTTEPTTVPTTVPTTETTTEPTTVPTTVPTTETTTEPTTVPTTVPTTETTTEPTTVPTTVPTTETTTEPTTVPTTVPTTETTTEPTTVSTTESETTTTAEEIETFTVSFANGDTIVYTVDVNDGGTVASIPAVPAKAGHTGKWMYNNAEFTTSIVITGDITVAAEYTAIEYTVTFKADSTIVDTKTVAYGNTVATLPTVPTKTGYNAGKWTYNSADFTTSTVITGNTTVVAEYTPIEYTVIFKSGSNVVSTKNVAYGATVPELPNVPNKTGYTGKWVYNSDDFTETTVVTGNMIVEAEYTAINYTVTFKADGATVATKTIAYGSTVATLPTIPAKTGHTSKWTYNSAEFTTSTVITGNTTVVAEYTPINYTVTFKADGATVATKTIAYGSTVATLPTIPAKTGHTSKWTYNSAEFTTSTVIEGNTTVVAEYTPINYTVTFKADGATVATRTIAYGSTVATLPTIPAKTGHTSKWTYNSAEFTTSTVIEGNTTVVAEYTAINYTVTFKADGATVATKTIAYGSTVATLPTIPAKTGHTSKWTYNSADFTTSTVIEGNTTVVAEYTAINYTVTFKADGAIVATKTIAYGSTVATLPTIPAKTGHTSKWTYNSAEFTTSTVIEGNTTVVAEYTPINYTVTFKADGATVDTKTIAYGSTVATLPTIPAKTGHTSKWTYNSAEFTTSTVIEGNTTVVAEYTAINYTVTFKADGATVDTKTIAYGSTVATLPTIPAKTGHTSKWTYNSADFTTSTVIEGNTTVVAEYTAINYTIKYVLSADDTVELARQENAHYGDAIETVTLDTILDTNSDGTYDYYLLKWEQPTGTVTGDMVIPVDYEEYANVVEVKITDAGGEVSHYLSKLGATITLPTTAAAHENYEFIGWGSVTSGGYADSSCKKGCTTIADNTGYNYYEYDYANAPIEKGGTVTLSNGNRLYEYGNGYTNFKFVAVYARKYTITFVEGGVTLATTEVLVDDYLSAAIDKVNLARDGYNIVYKYEDTVIDPNSWSISGDYEITVVYEPIAS